MDLKKYLSKSEIKKIVEDLMIRGFEKDDLKFRVNRAIRFFNSLPQNISLYRIISLSDISDFNKKIMGDHWTINKTKLLDSYLFLKDRKYFLIKAIGSSSNIILPEGFALNIEYPNEEEILIRDNLKFVSIDELKTQ